jgi:hypothetical protein
MSRISVILALLIAVAGAGEITPAPATPESPAIAAPRPLATTSEPATANEVARRYQVGTRATYRLTADAEHFFFPALTESAAKAATDADGGAAQADSSLVTVLCHFRVTQIHDGKLRVNFSLEGDVGAGVTAELDDIALTRFLPAGEIFERWQRLRATQTTRQIATAREGRGVEIKLWQGEITHAGKRFFLACSAETPFGVVEISAPAFKLEMGDFAW